MKRIDKLAEMVDKVINDDAVKSGFCVVMAEDGSSRCKIKGNYIEIIGLFVALVNIIADDSGISLEKFMDVLKEAAIRTEEIMVREEGNND